MRGRGDLTSRRSGSSATLPRLGLREQIEAGIRAFAAGDALGVPWEGRTSEEIARGDLLPIPRREQWPPGSTSDDTAQLLLLGAAVVDGDADPAAKFMELLARAAPTVRGLGPSTQAALARYAENGSLQAPNGDTNGAVMRAPVLGWAIADALERRGLVEQTTRTTHGGSRALTAAAGTATAAALALEGTPLDELGDAAQVVIATVAGEALAREVDMWSPEAAGVSMDAIETLAAVLRILRDAQSPADAAEQAVCLGGDTDTVAALAAGIVACHPGHAGQEIPWIDQVLLPPADEIGQLAAALARRRSV